MGVVDLVAGFKIDPSCVNDINITSLYLASSTCKLGSTRPKSGRTMLAGRALVRRSARLFSTAAAAETAAAPSVPLLINGKFVKSVSTAPGVPVRNPATQELLATTPIATAGEMRAAVDAAKAAFPAWAATSVSNRARVMFKLQALIRQHEDELAAILSSEHGKTIDDAKGDIFRGLEVVEHACSATSLQMGETTAGVAGSTDVHSYRLPLGVCANPDRNLNSSPDPSPNPSPDPHHSTFTLTLTPSPGARASRPSTSPR